MEMIKYKFRTEKRKQEIEIEVDSKITLYFVNIEINWISKTNDYHIITLADEFKIEPKDNGCYIIRKKEKKMKNL